MSRALYALKCFFLLCLCARNFCRLTMLSAYDALLSCTPAILKRDKISKKSTVWNSGEALQGTASSAWFINIH